MMCTVHNWTVMLGAHWCLEREHVSSVWGSTGIATMDDSRGVSGMEVVNASQVALDSALHAPGPVVWMLLTYVWFV